MQYLELAVCKSSHFLWPLPRTDIIRIVQRNMDLVRLVLLEIENKAKNDGRFVEITIEGYDYGAVVYHIMLLQEAGLIEAVNLTIQGGVCWKAKRLTWAGHEFLDAARSDTVWQKGKEVVQSATGTLTMEALKMTLPRIMEMLVNLKLP